jgi:oligosaccharide reducing-end xylanase
MPARGLRAGRVAIVAALLTLVAAACTGTTDSLGWNGASGTVLHPLSVPTTYPNEFRDVLGKSDQEISDKIAAVFTQLFHGDSGTTLAIYVTDGADQAHIQDVLHGDVRTEGMGYAMIIAVELDKRDEFDRLWRYSKANLEETSGPTAGYFQSSCDVTGGTIPCIDPFGYEQFATALLFANDRWGSTSGDIDYGTDFKLLLEVMRHKQDLNAGLVSGVTNTFDGVTALPFDVPYASAAGQSRPAIAMPAYYELWAQAVADPFWSRAAAAARAYWQRSANPGTGLWPVRASFDGTPVPGGDNFAAESYRAQLNMAVDRIWFGPRDWEVLQANRLLAFFTGVGLDKYCAGYSLDGTKCNDSNHSPALVAANGATALVASSDNRATFIETVWSATTPTGLPRYFDGIMQLLALLVLGGQYRVY